MEISKAALADLEEIHYIVHNTINEIYPNYYPAEVVDFFLEYHSYEHIAEDIKRGNTYIITVDGKSVGTGGIYQDNYIGRLYILPQYQGKGYGSALIKVLEEALSREHDTALLEASLPSYDYYEKRGYKPKEYVKYEVKNHRILCYYIMEKALL